MKRAILVLAPLLGGCWVVIGESFSGYHRVATVDVIEDDAADGPHGIDDCRPSFTLANGVTYPSHAPGPRIVTGAGEIFSTDKDCADNTLPYCLLLASTFRIVENATLLVGGSKPLVIVAVHDLTIENNGVLNVAGEENGGVPGPGDHTKGSAASQGGGGGNAEPGGASACGANGGPGLDTALVGGGHGGGVQPPASTQGCRIGGAGGGAVQLVSLCGTIDLRGTIDASGGGGGASDDPSCPEGAGGGAGGTVWLQGDVFFDLVTANVQLEGGGGGGGACRNASADPWTAGSGGSRKTRGEGATCGSGVQGGSGGAGGARDAPGGGANPVATTGEAKCGGGGGARGRLVLQNARLARCDGARHTGVCTELE